MARIRERRRQNSEVYIAEVHTNGYQGVTRCGTNATMRISFVYYKMPELQRYAPSRGRNIVIPHMECTTPLVAPLAFSSFADVCNGHRPVSAEEITRMTY